MGVDFPLIWDILAGLPAMEQLALRAPKVPKVLARGLTSWGIPGLMPTKQAVVADNLAAGVLRGRWYQTRHDRHGGCSSVRPVGI